MGNCFQSNNLNKEKTIIIYHKSKNELGKQHFSLFNLFKKDKKQIISTKYTLNNDNKIVGECLLYDKTGKLIEKLNYNNNSVKHGKQYYYNVGIFDSTNKYIKVKELIQIYDNGIQIDTKIIY